MHEILGFAAVTSLDLPKITQIKTFSLATNSVVYTFLNEDQ